MQIYYVYIVTNKTKSVLYIGITNNLYRRLHEHAENILLGKPTFAAKYKVRFLIYFEEYVWIQDAISRETQLKGWRREKKMELILSVNPNFDFLDSSVVGMT